jgi:hypothetical protein
LEEVREILEGLLENSSLLTFHNEPRQESESIHESLSVAELEPFTSTSQDSSVEDSPEPRTPKGEEIQPSEFTSKFEDGHSRYLLDTSNSFVAQLGEDPHSVPMNHSRNLSTELSSKPWYHLYLLIRLTKHILRRPQRRNG